MHVIVPGAGGRSDAKVLSQKWPTAHSITRVDLAAFMPHQPTADEQLDRTLTIANE